MKKTKSSAAPAKPSWALATIHKMTEEMKQRRAVLKWIVKHQARFDDLATPCTFYGGQIDFDNLAHKQVLGVMRAFPAGKWTKTPDDNARVNYEGEFDGMRLRCWRGEPPPSCKVVEEQVMVPARIETIRKLVCSKL